jgi:hypothetical protein
LPWVYLARLESAKRGQWRFEYGKLLTSITAFMPWLLSAKQAWDAKSTSSSRMARPGDCRAKTFYSKLRGLSTKIFAAETSAQERPACL